MSEVRSWSGAAYDRLSCPMAQMGLAVLDRLPLEGGETVIDAGCGSGRTLDELAEILTWSQLGLHRKPVAVLNIAGYFDGLLTFLDHAADEQLLRPEYRAMLLVDSDPARLLARMRAHHPPVVEALLRPDQT